MNGAGGMPRRAKRGRRREEAIADWASPRGKGSMFHETDEPHDEQTPGPWRPTRRVMMKAAATFAALAATAGATREDLTGALAQDSGTTRAERWSEVEEFGDVSVASAGEARTIK